MENKPNIETQTQNIYSQEDLLEPVIAALDDNSTEVLHTLILNLHPADIAELLNLVNTERRAQIIDVIGTVDSDVFPHLESEVKDEIISLLGAKSSAEAIDELETDEAIQFMEELSDENIEEILDEISDEKRELLEEALALPEDSAGRLSNSKYVAIPENWSVGEAIDFIRKSEDLPEDFHTVFVVDENHKPVSYIPLSRVMRNKREVKIADISEKNIITFTQSQDQEDTARIFRKYKLISAPVVDENGAMEGVISIDDIADVVEEEAEEDLLKLSGVGGDSDFYSNPFKMVRNRSPWLLVNLCCSVIASFVISHFQGEIQSLVALAVLMPIVATMSGNVGTQTLAVAVRAIASKELNFSNALRITRKELMASCINGLIFGFIVGVVSFIIYGKIMLGFTIFLAMFLTFMIGALIGSLAPLMLHRFGFDPAVAGSPFVFAVTDSSSFFIFLGLAGLILL
jgi:magnesium transporter